VYIYVLAGLLYVMFLQVLPYALSYINRRVFSRPALTIQLGTGVLSSAICSAELPVLQAGCGLCDIYGLLVQLIQAIGILRPCPKNEGSRRKHVDYSIRLRLSILSSNGLLMEKAVSLAYRVGNGQQHFNLPFWNWYLLGGKMTKRRFRYFAKC